MSLAQTHFVDLLQTTNALTVQWRAAPGAHARAVDSETLAKITKQLAAVAEAERQSGLARDVVAPPASSSSGAGLEAAQRALGETLYRVLDGQDRALARRLEAARGEGASLHLCVRLRTHDRRGLSRHPSLGWPFQVLCPRGEEPLVLAAEPPVTLSVQLGDAELAQSERVPGGRLQVLFMAYSPLDVSPVLDYEGEEERILVGLAPHVAKNRLVLRVAEEGSLGELRRRLMDRAYDVVHLTGHGVVTQHGAQLVMEDADGHRDDVSAERLLRVLRDGRRMPRMLVISSCHSAEHRNDLPSLAAELIEGGVPCVVGWTLPVLDAVATNAAEELYRRLCSGERPAEALAKARCELHRADRGVSSPSHAWATLQMLATKTAGFAIDPEEKPQPEAAAPGGAYRLLGNRMRVLAEGFVGRRRELQVLGRVLRRGQWTPPGGREHAVAGALVVGMKGQGKSCLVGRAIERHHHDAGELSMVVLHGTLDDNALLEAFRVEAVRLGDDAAERTLDDASRTAPQRIERLLRRRWRERSVVIVLDDFEQNLDILGEGDAQLLPFAASVLEVLLPICRDEKPKLLITSTARFELPAHLQESLAEVLLGPLEAASVHKLWSRGRSTELGTLAPQTWRDLSERFGRNARLLSWARQLLAGKTPDEVKLVMNEASERLPVWKGQVIDESKQEELVTAFLRHMGIEAAKEKVGPDAMAFIDRARVYDVPVPIEAFTGLVDGLAISLELCVAALSNLGLLELGCEDDRTVYRVSPLVKATFDAPDGERWHEVAAEYLWKTAQRGAEHSTTYILQSWEHSLASGKQALADRAIERLDSWHYRRGLNQRNVNLAIAHVRRFPSSVKANRWAGSALLACGKLQQGQKHLERALEIEESIQEVDAYPSIAATLHELARVMYAQGDLRGARALLERALKIREQLPDLEGHRVVASSLFELARVLHAQCFWGAAWDRLSQAMKLLEKSRQPEDQLAVASILRELAVLELAVGNSIGAQKLLEQSLEIQEKINGSKEHPLMAAALHELAVVLYERGRFDDARVRLELSLEIQEKLFGTEVHPVISASLHELGRVLHAQGDLLRAQRHFERALEIDESVYVNKEHAAIAATLHELGRVLHKRGCLEESKSRLECSLEIQEKVHGNRNYLAISASLHELGRVLYERGDEEEGRICLSRALQIDETRSFRSPLLIAREHSSLAEVLRVQGDFIGAQARLERSLEIRADVHGAMDSEGVASELYSLACVLLARRKQPDAQMRMEQSLAMWDRLYGPQGGLDRAIRFGIDGNCRWAKGRFDEIESALRFVMEEREKMFETRQHSRYAEVELALAQLLRFQSRDSESNDLFQHARDVLECQVSGRALLAQYQDDTRNFMEYVSSKAVALRRLDLNERLPRHDV